MQENMGVIGIGRLGICLALNLEKKYNVIGCDISPDYIESINNKTFVSNEPNVNKLLGESVNFVATTSLSEVLDKCDIIFIMVATPSLPNGKYDHSSVDKVIDEAISIIKTPLEKPKYLIIGCTVMPGYCQSIYDKLAKYNMHLVYNPEFIAQGDIVNGQLNPDIVLIGESDIKVGDIVENIHRSIITNNAKICRMGLTEAEITKIALNCFCTIKITYANMIGDLACKVKANPDIILNAIGQDSRIGNKYLKYGDGFGGVCFPRDNRALNIFANENNVILKLSEIVDDTNSLHLDYQIEDILKNIKDNSYTIDGVTYKKGTDIIEESQRLKRAVLLAQRGIKVTIRDAPNVIEKVKGIYGDLLNYESLK
jgi:UDPglucose 6-dehydrogenase